MNRIFAFTFLLLAMMLFSSCSKKDMLFDAVESGNLERLGILVIQGADINMKNKSGESLLHAAVKKNNVKTVQAVIDLKADVNTLDNKGNSPIFYAQSQDMLDLLIKHKADTAIKNKKGIAAMEYLKSQGIIK